jgi:SnoaL-like domain
MTNDFTVRELADRRAVTDLVLRLYLLLDEQRYDELSTVYADDVELHFPSGHMIGLEAVTSMARKRSERYDRMQHISTDIVVELDDDKARVRTNHLAFHVYDADTPATHFDAGLVHRFDAIRTADGWRIARGTADVIWTAGNDRS